MKKIKFYPDKRAMKVFKICALIIIFGILISLAVYINAPTPRNAQVCKQALFGCAFGFDIAFGALLYMDYMFKKEDEEFS